MALKDEPFTQCQSGTAPLNPDQQHALLAELPDWQLDSASGQDQLVRTYRFKSFARALAFANQVGELADSEDHHPAILIEWGRATVSWWTHSIGGLHRNDFVMAARTDALYG